MTDRAQDGQDLDDEGSPLAELSERITQRLQVGDEPGADELLGRYSSCSGPMLGLLPTLRELAELGRSISDR